MTVTGTSGSLSNSATINVSVGVPDFQVTYGNLSTAGETVNAGGSTTDTVTITPLMGFTGAVNFSCAGTTGYGSGLSCSLSPNSVSSGSYTSTLTVNASNSATTGAVTVTATSGNITHNRVIPVTVNTVANDFTLTVASAVLSIPSGTAITDNVTIAPVGGFNSDVALTCSVPSSLGTTTCTISPPTVTGGSGTALITVTGAVLSRDMGAPLPFNHRGFGAVSIFAMAMGGVFMSGQRRRLSKPAVRKVVLSLLLLTVALGAVSCGGGSNSGGGGGGPTPLTGNLTITATGGGITHTTTINVTVH